MRTRKGGEMLCGSYPVVPGSVGIQLNSLVSPRRSVLGSKDFCMEQKLFSFSFNASSTGLVSTFVLESDVTSSFDLFSLDTLISQLVNIVFLIPAWSILAY